MAIYNFDKIIERRGTDCSKWDGFEERFPGFNVKDALPMWVADMDFQAPREVIEVIKEKAEHGIYGYPCAKGKSFDLAVKNWLFKRHGWEIEEEWIVAVPGVVGAVTHAIQALTEEGDGVLIQTPVYYPFKDRCISLNKRAAVESPLVINNGAYEIDFSDFEKKASGKNTKMFILCSPHNPVGRVWRPEELRRLAEICQRNNVLIFSDEIHSDLIMRGYKHTASGLVTEYKNLISAYAPSKTFNLAGLKTSAIIVPDRELRNRYISRLKINEAAGLNIFGGAALESAYTYGEDYLRELLDYLQSNIDFAFDFVRKNLPAAHVFVTEGTYFLWLDFRPAGLPVYEINRKILEEAKVAGDLGEWFGEEGKGFLRLNLACPKTVVIEAMNRLKRAFGN